LLYIAENLLLRGGYRKTHFQADQTTLQNVSEMGKVYEEKVKELKLGEYQTFEPKFTRSKDINPPEIFGFREVILQALLRKYITKKFEGISKPDWN